MPNTYNWDIYSLDVQRTQNGLNDVVCNVHYGYTATSDQTDENGEPYTYTRRNNKNIAAPDANSFIELESLTKDDVVGWLESLIDVTKLNELLDRKLAEVQQQATNINTPF